MRFYFTTGKKFPRSVLQFCSLVWKGEKETFIEFHPSMHLSTLHGVLGVLEEWGYKLIRVETD